MAKLEMIISIMLGLVVVVMLVWWAIEVIRNPRPKDQRDDLTSRGSWPEKRR